MNACNVSDLLTQIAADIGIDCATAMDSRVLWSLTRPRTFWESDMGAFVHTEFGSEHMYLMPKITYRSLLKYWSTRWKILYNTDARHPWLFVRCTDGAPADSSSELETCAGNCIERSRRVLEPRKIREVVAPGLIERLSPSGETYALAAQFMSDEAIMALRSYDLNDVEYEGDKNIWIAFCSAERRQLLPQSVWSRIREVRRPRATDEFFFAADLAKHSIEEIEVTFAACHSDWRTTRAERTE